MNRKTTLAVILLILLLVAISGAAMYYRWNKPLGPSLQLPTFAPAANLSGSPNLSAPSTPADQEAVTNSLIPTTTPINSIQITSPPAPIAVSRPLCGGPASMTLLVIGSDQRGTSYLYGLADSIYAVYIDFVNSRVMVIDFPRDLWVEIPDIAQHYNITHGKINQAYLFGNPGMGYYDGPGEGPGLLARTLYLNFGLQVDHYVALDMQTLKNVVDAVGGIDVTVDSYVDLSNGYPSSDPKYFLSPGSNHLDGERAVIMATNRVPSTFQRIKYQHIILRALREKLLTPEMLPKIPGLVAQFLGSVRTDLSLSDINKLICIGKAVPTENIQADTFPEDLFTAQATFDEYRNLTTYTLEADFDRMRVMVADFMNGVWPFPTADSPPGNP